MRLRLEIFLMKSAPGVTRTRGTRIRKTYLYPSEKSSLFNKLIGSIDKTLTFQYHSKSSKNIQFDPNIVSKWTAGILEKEEW